MKRRKFTAEFKTKVAIEAIRGLKTLNEISSEYEVHPNQIAKWKKQLLIQAPQIFKDHRSREDDKEDKKEDEAKAQDDDGMDKEVKSLKEEVKALKAQLSKAKKASDENKEKEKDAALETAAEAEKTALRKEISEIKEHVAAQTPKQGVSQAGKADGAPTGSLDACVAEIGTWLASTGHAWEGEE